MNLITRIWNYFLISQAKWIFAFISIYTPIFSQTPSYNITHYTTNNGLSQNYVYCLLQDSKGFMWFGTRYGLNKFDGYSFTHYINKPFEKNSISHNTILHLLEDKNGMIWIATGGGGLCRYNRFTNEFISFKHNPNNPKSICDNFLKCLHLDYSGKLWIGTVGGLSMLDIPAVEKRIKDKPGLPFDSIFTFINYKHDKFNINSLGSDVVNGIIQDRFGNFLINTNSVIDYFEPVTEKWSHYLWSTRYETIRTVSNPDSVKLKFNLPYSFIKDKDEVYWMGHGFLSRFDYNSKTFRDYKKNIYWRIFCEDRFKNLWIGYDELYVIPKKNIINQNHQQPELKKHIITINGIISGFADSNGTVWIGAANGLYKIVQSTSGFYHIRQLNNTEEQNIYNIRALYEDKSGIIWIGTVNKGLKIFDRKNRLIASPLRGPILKNPVLGESVVNVILQDSSNNYWVGTRVGVYYSQNNSYSIKRILYSKEDIPIPNTYGNIFTLLVDHHNRIWIGGTKGNKPVLLIYNRVLDRFDTTNFPVKEIKQKGGTGIWKLFEDRKHRIWVCTTNGVFLFDEPSKKITHFFSKENDLSSLNHDETWMIFEDHASNIWVGTMGGGLNLWNQKTKSFTHFTQEDGLAGNIVYGILEDEKYNLWISTNNGISKFNPNSEIFCNYLTNEIRGVGQFNHACLKTEEGYLLFGGQNGLIIFHPDSIKEERLGVPLLITSFSVLGKKIRREINHGEEISIPYNDNYLTMEFASLDYRDSPNLKYAYKLEGVNNNWVEAGTQRFTSYSNLFPGYYLFQVKATNSYGLWNEKGIAFTIHIVPPMYMTAWFKWSVGIMILLIFSGLLYWRIEFVRRKEQNRRRLIESELQALRLQMNPHFIFNSLNAIQNFVINNNEEKASEYLSKFARLMRMILENSKRQTIYLKDEIEFLNLYLEIESLRFEERFDYAIHVDHALSGDYGIPSMLLQPYIENAIRHGFQHKTSKGMLIIKLALQDDTIIASIIDNGIGRKKAMEIKERQGFTYKAFGMEITHDRLKILNSFRKKEMKLNIIDLYTDKGEPGGTQVEISIPV